MSMLGGWGEARDIFIYDKLYNEDSTQRVGKQEK